MKNLIASIILFSVVTSDIAFAQQSPTAVAKLSPLTQLYFTKAEKLKGTNATVPNYIYKTDAANVQYVSAIIKVGPDVPVARLEALGAHIGTRAGDIWTVQVPIAQVKAFTEIKGIVYIQLDEPAFPTLDSARKATRADSAQSGIGLPHAFNGNNVIVGIIDAGFDYRHPSLFDTSGNGYRVKKIWEQKTTGTPPAGYIYGNEMTDSLAMWAAGTDNATTPHGTHVAGIAAGSGYGAGGNSLRYRGMAYKSDIVMVGITPDKSQWINTGAADMIDGMNYIYTYAGSLSRPAVANLSWGSPLGPRDGTGLFSQACDNLTGAGKIFVCSAGNNGENKIHLQKTFTPSDTAVNSFLNIAATPLGKQTWVDIWGDTGKTFCLAVSLFTTSNTQINTTGFVCIDNTIHHMYLIGSNNDTCFIDIVTSSAEFNQRPRIFVELLSKVPDNVLISVKGTDGKINMWNSYVYKTTGYYGSFSNNGLSWAINGTTDMTISDIAASKSALTVGAYASKISFTNTANATLGYSGYVAKGNLVPFSSRGPTADGRVKPDITGPGLTVGSAISSYDTSFASGGSSYLYIVSNWVNPQNNRNYSYGQLSGTSMSSPAVSGIVAMLLQADPTLDPQDIKNILTETAIKDAYTGTIAAGGNNNWGNGKVNAYRAVIRAVGIGTLVKGTLNCNLFPNPNKGQFTLQLDSRTTEIISVNIYDVTGRKISAESWKVQNGNNMRQFDLRKLANGVYFVAVSSANDYALLKTVVE